MGESRDRFREALGAHIDVIDVDSIREAVRTAWRLAPPHGTVLLAPACASFDMFRDYAERGEAFKDEVLRLESDVSRE
jgi:UDP-N-acetylmuramoylalanine--D-glutamate ligase